MGRDGPSSVGFCCQLQSWTPPAPPKASYAHVIPFVSLLLLPQFRCFSSTYALTSNITPEWSSCLKSYFSPGLSLSVWNSNPICCSLSETYHQRDDIPSPVEVLPDPLSSAFHASPLPPPTMSRLALYLTLHEYGTMCCFHDVHFFTPWTFDHDSPLPVIAAEVLDQRRFCLPGRAGSVWRHA